MKKPELLAPAGSLSSMKAAVSAGADAIYIGGKKYGARAYADNPSCEELLRAIDFCHLHNCKVYLTVNTLFKDEEIDELYEYIRPLYENGLDAVLVQDLGVLTYLRDNFKALNIHASTQMAVSSHYGASMLKSLGVSRLVLPREATYKALTDIIKRSKIETEVFVHGALCYCFSGQCLMSSLIGGRSGNRGRCAQVCRLPFQGGHLLNLKDLNTLSILPDIIDTGVTSLKIEGRMKSARYASGVTSVYRKYIDLYMNEGREGYKVSKNDTHILSQLFDRGGTTTGYFERHNSKQMIYTGEKPNMRKVDENLLKKIDEQYINNTIKEKIEGKIILKKNKPSCMQLTYKDITIKVFGDTPDIASSKPLSRDVVYEKASKFGDTDFDLEGLDVEIDDDIFMPVSSINQLRRDATQKLTREILSGYKRANL